MSNVTQMVPATVIDWPNTGLVHHNQVSRYLYRAYIFNLKFYFWKKCALQQTHQGHSCYSYLELKWKGYLIKLKAHSFRSPTG